MARRRMISPDMWTDPKFMPLSIQERLLFIGLISMANDYGKLRGIPCTLRGKIYPGDSNVTDEDIENWLEALRARELIYVYTVSGEPYRKLMAWDKNQTIQHKSKKDEYPDPPHESSRNLTNPHEDSRAFTHKTRQEKTRQGKEREEKTREEKEASKQNSVLLDYPLHVLSSDWPLESKLKCLGIEKPQATIQDYGDQRVREVLDYLRCGLEKGETKSNCAGYIVAALKGNWDVSRRDANYDPDHEALERLKSEFSGAKFKVNGRIATLNDGKVTYPNGHECSLLDFFREEFGYDKAYLDEACLERKLRDAVVRSEGAVFPERVD